MRRSGFRVVLLASIGGGIVAGFARWAVGGGVISPLWSTVWTYSCHETYLCPECEPVYEQPCIGVGAPPDYWAVGRGLDTGDVVIVLVVAVALYVGAVLFVLSKHALDR